MRWRTCKGMLLGGSALAAVSMADRLLAQEPGVSPPVSPPQSPATPPPGATRPAPGSQNPLPTISVQSKRPKPKPKPGAGQPAPTNQTAQPAAPPAPNVGGGPAAPRQPYQLNLNQPSTAGSRLNLTPLQTPASVTVIPGDQIREQGDPTIADAIGRAVGITVNPFIGDGTSTISARGFYGANSITMLYDGMPLFNAGGVTIFPFDPWNVNRIEVLNGSSSVLYGTGGVGGAINVVPKEPNTTQQTGAFQESIGSFGTVHTAAEVTGPINSQWSYLFDVSQNSSNGWTQPNGDSSSLALSGALRYATPDFVVTLRDDYGDIHPSVYEGTPTYNGNVINALRFINYNVLDAYAEFRENRLQLKEELSINSNVSFTNDSYYITQYRRYHDCAYQYFVPATDSVNRTFCRDIHANQTQIGDHGFVTIQSQPFNLKNETLIGFDANQSYYDRWDNQNSGGAGGSLGSSTVSATDPNLGTFASTGATLAVHQYDLTLNQAGVFVEDHLTLTDKLSILAGVRGDEYRTNLLTFPSNSKYGGIYTGPGYHIGLIYNPIKNVSLYTRYSVSTDPVTSLASDSASDILFGLSPAQQIEVGAKGTFLDNHLETTVAVYDIVKRNVLTTNPSNPSLMETAGEQSSKGIEGSIAYKITDTIRIAANGTILNAKFDNYTTTVNGVVVNLAGYRPYLVPDQTANLLATWDFLPDWQLRGALRYVGDRFTDNTDLTRMPAYTVVDLGLRWNVTKNVSLDLRVNNLMNTIYAVGASSVVNIQYLLGEPRNIIGTLKFTF
jgi:iron complex outermembrane recepter protein